MGRKAKEGSVNLYYLKNQKDKKDKSVSQKRNKPKKNTTVSKNNINKKKSNSEKFNFDEEFVIGVTKVSEEKKKTNNKVKEKSRKTNSSKTKKGQPKNNSKKNSEKSRRTFKVFKYIFLTSSVIVSIICFMISPVFNIVNIEVTGNNKISNEAIISLSEIMIGENIFKLNKNNIVNKIKQNAYIENVIIERNIPSTLKIDVKERQATYMLEYVNGYAYINNQGYMLEISEEKIERPILIGISTNVDNIKEGNRLIEEDLIKLENVLKIMESATSNEIEKLITKIDISDKFNYILHMETEGKIVKLGDTLDISTKMLHIKKILETEAGLEGEIIVDTVSENSKSRFIQKIN